MSNRKKFDDAHATYTRHGWRLVRVLARPETLPELTANAGDGAQYKGAPVAEYDVDAMWFTRASQAGREAWELRLVADTPYALFELFEPDESEEDREDVRREMEARLRDYTSPRDESESQT
ncbi:MAG TPA: hypothetical protein VM936_07195 [Pyrinomonadaceae bacterium]|jgi:hypothetical protein|nr:hypothetical protein [Pyrinomonadaceae bacterium]